MSLLLDALKKAAEQKAEKSKPEVPQAGSSDETVIDDAAEEISALESGVDEGLQQPRRPLSDETETEIDHSDFETRLERTLVEPEDGTETRLEIPDSTETESPSLSEQMQTGEDETIIFAEEDVADFLGEPEFVSREPRVYEDETDLSQLLQREDETGVGEPSPAGAGDETDLSQLAPGGDDTDISQPYPQARASESGQQVADQDETDISLPPASVADLEHAAAQQAAAAADSDSGQFAEPDEDITDAGEEDMSLLLVERDQTNLTIPTSVTDPQMPREQMQALQDDGGDDGLALVDTTRHRMPDQTAPPAGETLTSATATTGIGLDTQTGATTRIEATSTRTYAPDNYDRTLMRLPSDDASKLFAGMKSDSDVVMTPEYAKKVFNSKSSAQRLQHYKFYGGIAIVIMLAIFIFGLFEYQNQSANIDASLRPLKRDPMPGIIRLEKEADSNRLFSGSEVDERTIDLIESAENGVEEMVPDAGVIAEDAESAAEAVALDNATQAEAAVESETVAQTSEATMTASQTEADSGTPSQDRQQATTSAGEEPAMTTAVAGSAQPTAADSEAGASSASLKISLGVRVDQKSIWLREAYAAYQAGNDELAMSLYNKVLELDSRNRNALLARAAIHAQNNNSQHAIRDYQTLLLANPKDSLAMASLLAIANYSPQESETQLKLMIRDEPDSPYLNFALANAYGAQNRWQEAQGYYFKALERNPGDPNYAYNLAVSLEHIAQPGAAISYYRRALDNFGNGLATFSREVVDQRLKMLGNL